MTVQLLTGVVLLASVGCTALREAPTYDAPEDRQVIGRVEIEASTARDVFELIRGQRPRWINYRGPQSFMAETELQVYLNDIHLGGYGQLRGFTLEGVHEIEYLDPSSATMRWGTGHARGAIVIRTDRRR